MTFCKRVCVHRNQEKKSFTFQWSIDFLRARSRIFSNRPCIPYIRHGIQNGIAFIVYTHTTLNQSNQYYISFSLTFYFSGGFPFSFYRTHAPILSNSFSHRNLCCRSVINTQLEHTHTCVYSLLLKRNCFSFENNWKILKMLDCLRSCLLLNHSIALLACLCSLYWSKTNSKTEPSTEKKCTVFHLNRKKHKMCVCALVRLRAYKKLIIYCYANCWA